VSGTKTYQFEFWVKGTYISGEFYVYVRWFRDSGASDFISQTPFRIMSNLSSWALMNDTITAPSDAVTCDIFFRAETNSSGDIQIDDLMIQEISSQSEAEMWFRELFYGSAKWLSLAVLLAIIILVSTLTGYGGVIFLPITIFLGIDYFSNIPASSDFMWGALMMMFSSVYILLMLGLKLKRR
jgi:hypothetical protein